MIIKIRRAQAEDAVPCARILGDWFTATEWLPRLHTPTEDLRYLRQMIGQYQVIVADKGGVAVGFLAREGASLSHLYVGSQERGKGIGGQLVEAAKGQSNRLELWCFQANEGAQKFYEDHALQCVETTDGAKNEEGVPDMKYVWEEDAA